jgi:hypothetical protein
MLKCYADDSGSDLQPGGIFLLAGYIMDESRWEDFAEQWDVQLNRDHPIDFCRMADAERGEGPFLGIDSLWRKRKVKDLAAVIHGCHPEAFVCLMSCDQYERAIKGKVDPRLDNPYAILFFKVMAMISQLQLWANTVATFGHQPVDFIFDDQGQAGLKCLQWYAGLRERVPEPFRTMIGNTPQFKDDRRLLPLQAADMLAWHIRREHEFPAEDRTEVFSLISPAGIWQYRVKESELETIADAFKNRVDTASI